MLLAMVTQVSFGWLGVALCLAYGYAGGDKKRQALFTVLLTLLYSASLLFSGVARGWVTISLCAALSGHSDSALQRQTRPARQGADVFLLRSVSAAPVRAAHRPRPADHPAGFSGVTALTHAEIRDRV